jgi:hypothetical protein
MEMLSKVNGYIWVSAILKQNSCNTCEPASVTPKNANQLLTTQKLYCKIDVSPKQT